MASPWTPQPYSRRPQPERPWMGLALLLAVPLLSLVLIRMLWSGSTVWFLIAGILLLGAAAFAFLSRRSSPSYGYQTLSPEPNRMPVVLLGLGALFLALLILPNVSSGDSTTERLRTANPAGSLTSSRPVALPTLARQTPRAQPTVTPAQAPAEASSAADATSSESDDESSDASPSFDGETYVVQEGDTLWDIAERYGTTVDDIAAANDLDNAAALTLGQELIIPASSTADAGDTGAGDTASEPEATPTE